MSGGKKTGGKRTAAEELDGLTGILKKSVAEARITSMLSGNPGGTLFLCDLDNLRRINNQHGHLAGDECLKEAAQIIMYMIRPDTSPGTASADGEATNSSYSCPDAAMLYRRRKSAGA